MFAIAVTLCGGGLVLVKCTFRMRIETLCSPLQWRCAEGVWC